MSWRGRVRVPARVAIWRRRGADQTGPGPDARAEGDLETVAPVEPPADEQSGDAPEPGPLHHRDPGSPLPLVPQPVIAMRARRHLRMITWGLGLAVVGAVATVIASLSMLRLTDTGRLWPAAGNAAAVAAAIAALVQWRLWRLGLREWEGRQDVGLAAWLNVSAACVWLALACAVVTPVAADRVVADSTSAEPAWWMSLLGTACVILGAALAGIHRFRPEGPRGVPPLIRRNHGVERRH